MNFKTTSILLILLIAVGTYLYFSTGGEKPADPQKQESGDGRKLFTFSAGDVKKLTITPEKGQRMVFVRDGINWKIAEPIAAPADSGDISALVSDLAGLQSTNTTTASEGTGLKTPRFVVDLETDKTTTLHIGQKSTVGDRLYVQVKGNDQADVVSSAVLEKLNQPLEEFRDKQLITLGMPQVKYVSIQQPTGKLEAVQEGGKWQVTAPQQFPGDETEIGSLIGDITRLRATEFVAGSPTTPLYGLNGPAEETTYVTVSTTGPTTQPAATQPAGTYTIAIGQPDSLLKKNHFATVQGSNQVVKIAKDSLAFLDRKAIDLRDKAVIDIDPASVNILSVVIDTPATTQPTTRPAENKQYVAKRRPPAATQPATTQPSTQPAPTTWVTLEGADANDDAVSSILTSLHPLRAEKYVDSAAAGGKTIAVKIETGGGGVRVVGHTEIKFVVPPDGKPPVGVYNGLTFEVSRSLIDRLETDFTKPGPAPIPTAPMPEMGPMMP